MFYFFLKGLQSPVYSYEDMQMLQSKLSTLVCETVVCYVWIIFWLPLICFSQSSFFVGFADGLISHFVLSLLTLSHINIWKIRHRKIKAVLHIKEYFKQGISLLSHFLYIIFQLHFHHTSLE